MVQRLIGEQDGRLADYFKKEKAKMNDEMTLDYEDNVEKVYGHKLSISEYQKLAARTLLEKPGFTLTDSEIMTIWNSTGLAGEAGEVADEIKKGIFHKHGLDMEKLQKELGDCLWYITGICTTLGLNLETIMSDNIEKLKVRYPNGYSSADSIKSYKERHINDPDPELGW